MSVRCRSTAASISSSVVPRSSSRCTSRASIAIATETDAVSTSLTRSGATSPAASDALAKVPDSFEEMWSE